jgi:hypothetical protein
VRILRLNRSSSSFLRIRSRKSERAGDFDAWLVVLTLRCSADSALLSNPEPGKGVKQSKCVEEPHHYANYDHGIQDRLDGTRHRDELVDQPEDYPDHDQSEQYLN